MQLHDVFRELGKTSPREAKSSFLNLVTRNQSHNEEDFKEAVTSQSMCGARKREAIDSTARFVKAVLIASESKGKLETCAGMER
jgi:hypothetical protein